MRRIRKEATKVWHNPELNTFAQRGGGNGGVARASSEHLEEKRAVSQHRAALEALFAPKPDSSRASDGEPSSEGRGSGAPRGRDSSPGGKAPGRIVLTPPPSSDPKVTERQKLLSKLLNAEGRPNVSRACDDFLKAGHTFPDEQDVYLQLLEHGNEEHVRSAIDSLGTLLNGELPKRKAVLESRLRRIEQFAEEPTTRAAAEALRRRVGGGRMT